MRVLFVSPRPPWPIRRGDQVRLANLVEGLRSGHEIRVLALCPAGFPDASFPAGVGGRTVPLSRAGQLAGLVAHLHRLPAQVALHVSRPLRRAFRDELEQFRPDVVVLVLSRLGWLAEEVPKDIPVVVDLIDSLELNLTRRAKRERVLGPLVAWEARRIGAYDRDLAQHVDAVLVISERDRRAVVGEDADLAPRLHVVPASLAVPESVPPWPAGNIVLLSGNLGYFPTVDGAVWFAREVWPRIRARRADAEWWLAGARPAPAIRRLADEDGVRLLANPEDLGTVRCRAAVSVAPLLSGSGTANKILEAMADGVPVVTTPSGREGLDRLDDGVLGVAEEPKAFADAVVELLEDPAMAEDQVRRAWEWLRDRHARPRVAACFEEILSKAVLD